VHQLIDGSNMVTFEDWLISQTSADRPRRTIAQLMLDRKFDQLDFGASVVREEFRRMLKDFEKDTAGLPVMSRPKPFRTTR
jgi:hypothetical protein